MKYIAYYDCDNLQKRQYVLSATDKIDYICSVLKKNGIRVEIISASMTNDPNHCAHRQYKQIEEGKFVKLCFSFPWGNKIQKILSLVISKVFLFKELMKVRRNEKVIVYHSLSYMKLVRVAHWIKKFYLVLEVEEIYSDVTRDERGKKKEIDFLHTADSYLFPTIILNKVVNISNRPYAIVHGTYRTVEKINSKKNDKIHVVYAGTFDPRKGGALAAIEAAKYLPEQYHIHILGFGNAKEIENICRNIERVKKNTAASISYDGCLSGKEYTSFIQTCDIGLSTQNPNAQYNDTSFPSKILSYMANGLRVVSVRIPVVETSGVGDVIYYYNEQTPECIAEAIKKVDLKDNNDSHILLKKLDEQFGESLMKLLKSKGDY